LLFARLGCDAAPAPMTMKQAIANAPADARTPPLIRDMILLPQSVLCHSNANNIDMSML
jgi:hypothetical protein